MLKVGVRYCYGYCEHTKISVKKEMRGRIRKNRRYKRVLFSEKSRLKKFTVEKLQ